MKCPVCKNSMIVVEHHKIELDYCTNCHGVWFDHGELDLMLESLGRENTGALLGNILQSAEAASSEQKRKCPICRQQMKKTAIGQPPTLLDACRKGDGLWFDGGELGHLLKQMGGASPAGPGAPQELTGFLKEVFKATGPKQ